MSKISEALIREWSAGDAERDRGLSTPEDIERINDIQYGADERWNLLDIYRPKNNTEKLPVLVIVHGGAWVYGTKEVYQFYGMSLAQKGFAVVNANYRLAPEHKFPAQLEDVNQQIEFVLKHAGEYGMDSRNIFMTGDSAGAHILGLYLGICTDPEYASLYPFQTPEGFLPRAVLMNCGVYDIGRTSIISEEGDRMLMQDLLPMGGTEAEMERIQVTGHVNAKFPPTFIATAVGDFAGLQAPFMEASLKKAGVPYEYRIYGTAEQPLYHNFEINQRDAAGIRCNEEEIKFLKRWIQY